MDTNKIFNILLIVSKVVKYVVTLIKEAKDKTLACFKSTLPRKKPSSDSPPTSVGKCFRKEIGNR